MASPIKKIAQKDFFSALCFLLLGLFLSLRWPRSSIWSASGPEEGFFPLVAGFILAGCSLFIMGRGLILTRAHEGEIKLKEDKDEVNVFKVFSYILWMSLLFGVLLERVGFLITSAFFLVLTFKYVEKQNWKMTILVGSASTIIAYFLFVYFLGVPLPKGLIKL